VTRWASVLALLALLVPAAARADGDPASDYLLTQPVFTPFSTKLPEASVEQLKAVQADAKKQGYEVRVALIASRNDLGAVPSLFAKPQIYARFLWQEVRFVYHGPLLVVMPNGFGYWEQSGDVDGEVDALAALKKPSEYPDLAQAGTAGVQAVAEVNGVTVTVPPLASGGGATFTRDRILIAVGAVVLAFVVAGAFWLRRRSPERP
jgi:hypothetical protein